jgi:hypothetical protein
LPVSHCRIKQRGADVVTIGGVLDTYVVSKNNRARNVPECRAWIRAYLPRQCAGGRRDGQECREREEEELHDRKFVPKVTPGEHVFFVSVFVCLFFDAAVACSHGHCNLLEVAKLGASWDNGRGPRPVNAPAGPGDRRVT